MADDIALVENDLIMNLLDNLPAGYTEETVDVPNGKFDTPNDTKWLRTTINLAPKENVQAGGGYKRQFGIFTIDIFYPKGTGSKAALADFILIKDLYENQAIGDAKCEEVSPNIIHNNDNWYNVQADVTFYYEGP